MSSPVGASVTASFPEGTDGEVEIGFAFEERMSLVARAPASLLPSFSAELTDGPMQLGRSSANLLVMGTLIPSGTVRLSIEDGRLVGGNEDLELTFDGRIVLSCRVPPSRLPQPADGNAESVVVAPDGEGPVPDASNVVEDDKFETANCSALRDALL